MSSKPTVVLVHGALSDASIWAGVSGRLQQAQATVLAPAMPMRNLAADVDYLRYFLDSVEGPKVLVGHSYGGTVISHPAFAADDVTALVYVSAFAPDTGESTGELNGRYPGSKLGADTTVVRATPDGNELYLRPEHFAEVYAGDLDPHTVAVMAAAQRPIDPAALGDSFTGAPAWSVKPSWALISTADASLPPDAMRFMADRAGSKSLEVDASHASPRSRPETVVELVTDALDAG